MKEAFEKIKVRLEREYLGKPVPGEFRHGIVKTISNRTHAEIYGSRVLDWCACPYCGKKVKVVE